MQVQSFFIYSAILASSLGEHAGSESEAEARMLGLDTGNPAADHEAGMWIAGLIGNGYYNIRRTFLLHVKLRHSDGCSSCGAVKSKFGLQEEKICR